MVVHACRKGVVKQLGRGPPSLQMLDSISNLTESSKPSGCVAWREKYLQHGTGEDDNTKGFAKLCRWLVPTLSTKDHQRCCSHEVVLTSKTSPQLTLTNCGGGKPQVTETLLIKPCPEDTDRSSTLWLLMSGISRTLGMKQETLRTEAAFALLMAPFERFWMQQGDDWSKSERTVLPLQLLLPTRVITSLT